MGSTKTRLSPPLSNSRAAALYEAMLLDTIALGTSLHGIDVAIAITPPDSRPYFANVSPANTLLIPVECAHIGECLHKSFQHMFEKGYQKVCALNSDGPTLPPEIIQSAYRVLDDCDLVIGPGEDGGYYLIGMKLVYGELFTGIDWSTGRVLTQTLEKSEGLDLQIFLLPTWYDVDTVRDVERLAAEIDKMPQDRLVHTRRFFSDS